MPGITDEQIKRAYPYFYGQIVYSREKAPDDPDGRTRLSNGFKPYAQFADNAVEVMEVGGDGLIKDTLFYKDPDDLAKKFTSIHRYCMGLRDMKVPGGDTAASVGKEGWFKQEPGRNGFQGNVMPVSAPRVNGQPVPTPARPDDWDLEAWLSEHSTDGDAEAESGAPSPTAVPEERYGEIAALLVGKAVSSKSKTLLASPLSTYSVPELNVAVQAMIDQGILVVDNNTFASGPAR